MGNISLEVKQQTGNITVNFEDLEKALDAKLSEYKGAVFTEKTKDIAKAELVELRKYRKELDDSRKTIKKEWMKPYDEFEQKAKLLLAKFDEPIGLIDGQVKEFDEKRKSEKREEIKKYFDESIGEMDVYLALDKIYNSKWENVSASMKSIKAEIDEAINKTSLEVATIKETESEAVLKALEQYRQSLNCAEALAYITNYEKQKLEIIRREEERRLHQEIEKVKTEGRTRIEEIEKAKVEALEQVAAEKEAVEEKQVKAFEAIAEESSFNGFDVFEEEQKTVVIYKIEAVSSIHKDIVKVLDSFGVRYGRREVNE